MPSGTNLASYRISDIPYIPFDKFCDVYCVQFQYDPVIRAVTLSKEKSTIRLMVGSSRILFAGSVIDLGDPVRMHKGRICAPERFKDLFVQRLVTVPRAMPLKKVVLDAGHGGKDPGAVGASGMEEKEVTLDIVKRLKGLLEKEGIAVEMTRKNDSFISLPERVAFSNATGAELFLSIHANASEARNLSGFEIYYITPELDDAQRAVKSARDDRLNLDDSCFAGNNRELKLILWDMIHGYNKKESVRMCRNICAGVGESSGAKILGVKNANFAVLRGAAIPAVLIEVGFLSNSREEQYLSEDWYRQKIAEGILSGLRSYSQSFARKG